MARYPLHFDGNMGLLEDDYRCQANNERSEAREDDSPAEEEKEEEK